MLRYNRVVKSQVFGPHRWSIVGPQAASVSIRTPGGEWNTPQSSILMSQKVEGATEALSVRGLSA
jgi:hypothetical protein